MKSKALDELRQSSLTLEGGDMPLLEDMASGIDELFQKKSNVTSQVRDITQSPQTVFRLLLFLLFYRRDLPPVQNPESC